MTDEAQPEKAKRGWPKGKARGPRKPREPQTAQTPAPVPVAPPAAPQAPNPAPPQPPVQQRGYEEPILVVGSLKSGKEFSINCSDFDRQNGSWVLVSTPSYLPRSHKNVTYLKAEDVSAISITAPEAILMARLRPAQSQPAQTATSPPPAVYPAPQVAAAPPPPQVSVNPYSQAARDAHANMGETIQNPQIPILPMSRVTAGEDGRPTVIGATMAKV